MPAIGQVPIAPAVAAPIPVGAISVASLAALTLAQQDTIVRGTIVVTPTQTYVYTGAGSKTSSASYINLIGANLVLTNDSRISGIAAGSITTSNAGQINLGSTGGSITSDGYGGSINTGGYGGQISTNNYGGTLNLSDHAGSITTGPYGGSINTTGLGSIGLGTLISASGSSNAQTLLLGSATGSDKTITFPNTTGTIALTSDSRFTQYYFRGYAFSPTVGTTAEVWQATYTIPANAMGPNGYITADIWASCSQSVTAKRIRVWITSVNPGNAIPNLGLFSRIVSYSTGTSATPASILRGFQIYNRNSVSSQIIHPSASGGAGTTTSADSFEETNFNTATPLYLVVGLQKDSTGDTLQLKAVNMSVIYGS